MFFEGIKKIFGTRNLFLLKALEKMFHSFHEKQEPQCKYEIGVFILTTLKEYYNATGNKNYFFYGSLCSIVGRLANEIGLIHFHYYFFRYALKLNQKYLDKKIENETTKEIEKIKLVMSLFGFNHLDKFTEFQEKFYLDNAPFTTSE